MDSDEDILPYPEAKKRIQEQYIDRVFGFMAGKLKSVAKPKEFVGVVEIVMHQCDNETHAGYLHAYF